MGNARIVLLSALISDGVRSVIVDFRRIFRALLVPSFFLPLMSSILSGVAHVPVTYLASDRMSCEGDGILGGFHAIGQIVIREASELLHPDEDTGMPSLDGTILERV